jgi:hypothetical protein
MLSPASAALAWHSDETIVAEGNSALSLWWRADGGEFAACGQSWEQLSGYLRSRGIAHLDGLYVLLASPPADGSMLITGGRISADRLYVPERWLADPEARDFLGQGIALGMQPMAAEAGPFAYRESGATAVLTVRASGFTLAFAPFASVKDFAGVSAALALADAAVLNVPASRAAKLPGALALKSLVLPGAVEGLGHMAYNITGSRSIEMEKKGGAAILAPWVQGWADGIQGNFR